MIMTQILKVIVFLKPWHDVCVTGLLNRVDILYTGKIRPRFIFALWHEGEFKTGLIQLFIKDYVRKLESGRIQDWAKQFQISIGRK